MSLASGGAPVRRQETLAAPTRAERLAARVPVDDRPLQPQHPYSEPLHKRRRLNGLSAHAFDRVSLSAGLHRSSRPQPPSPLFFSHSRRGRPQLPPRFSSSEAAARMLSRTREDIGVKTVTLARGSFTGLSSPGAANGSSPRSASADGNDRNDFPRILSSLGVCEFLEEDTRPTFIIDLGDSANASSGAGIVLIVFANHALRSNAPLWQLVAGESSESLASDATDPSAQASTVFKDWLFSAVVQGAPNVNPLPVEHGGIIWSCFTLKRRICVVSGVIPCPEASSVPSTTVSRGNIIPSASVLSSLSRPKPHSATFSPNEPKDYFGVDNIATTGYFPQGASGNACALLSDPAIPDVDDAVTLTAEDWTRPEKIELPPPESALAVFSTECAQPYITTQNADSSRPCTPGRHQHSAFFDWTRLPEAPNLPQHIQLAHSVDWASTALGPIEVWTPDLRQLCNLVMASPHPAAMYWGEDMTAIYNEAFVLLAGQKHPGLMGCSFKEAWSEIWTDVKDVFLGAKRTGQATMKDDDCLFIERNGFLEEVYFSWSVIPVVGEDGSVVGLYHPAFEKTRRKIAERRMLTLREVGERTATAEDVKSFWQQVLASFSKNELDSPFVLLYSVSDDTDSEVSPLHSSSWLGAKSCCLEGTLGVPNEHPCAPETIDLKDGAEGFGPVFREAMKTDKPVLLSVGSADLPLELLDGLHWRGFGDPCRDVVVCPIHPTTGEVVLGYLVMGINPRRPYDEDYALFIQLLSRQLATSLASVVLFEDEIRRGEQAAKLAAEDRIVLSEQLAARTQEAKDSGVRFTKLAEYSPAGLFIADRYGSLTYCNDTYYEISRVPRDLDRQDRWIEYVKEEDQPIVRSLWRRLIENTESVNVEFRFKAPWQDRNGNKGDTWVLFSAFPERHEAGTHKGMHKSVFGCITNISQQKWSEGFQKRKTKEALELKRQQENFIDITSHEMRNPLSAILQCADEISSGLSELRSGEIACIEPDDLGNSIDAAQTIALCAQHQKRIVDDVLTLSKIDSAMLLVTPVDVQALQVVQRALKMFESEVHAADIQMDLVVDDSFRKLDVDWVKLDPSRVLQVLINLITNAIKFTTARSARLIKVILSASRDPPSASHSARVEYFPSRPKRAKEGPRPDWGSGEQIFIAFAVQDTGRGLSVEEKKLLFQRFSQATPRTHVQYGGSGLGLFISRELTEMQGGEIGVASAADKGSTFAFYIKCHRTSPPTAAPELVPLQPASARRPLSESKRSTPKTSVRTNNGVVAPAMPFGVDAGKATVNEQRLKVLIVEDNLVNQKVLRRQLSNHGLIVHVANHGGEALERLKASQYWHDSRPDALQISVVLMDKEMPVVDGLECTSRIREWEGSGLLRRHVPIIAVTANARSEQISELLEAGMDDVVSKPFRIAELFPKIEELVAKFPDIDAE